MPVVGAYAVFGFARHSYRVFLDPLAIAPLVVDGVFSWLLLSFVAWAVVALTGSCDPWFTTILRATGHAHAALVAAATGVFLLASFMVPTSATRVFGVVAVAWFAGAAWAAVSGATGDSTWRSVVATALGLLGWASIAGWELWRQAGHLL